MSVKQDYVTDAEYLRGAGDALQQSQPAFASRLKEAGRLLDDAAKHMCGQGFFGCHGGDGCTSDHK